MTWSPSAIASRIPLTLPDLLVIGGFVSVVAGLYMTFGAGPTLMAGGAAVIWVGGVLYRNQEGATR